ncbi:glutamyl-Q tRNA(Asp) synthetase [Pseudomonas aeruginosa PA38182]|nr:glutamyl-Q tRNA(Asp) synthetase [Pseudomonas aeruginosa PA38182]
MTSSYVGRFAPTPSGYLHFGSLVAAVASYLDARAVGGRWLVRMEDLDPPREVPGAQQAILETLERYGFEWDGAVERQSERFPDYAAVVEQLLRSGLAYACTCSRKQLEGFAGIYPASAATPGTPARMRRSACACRSWNIASSTACRAKSASISAARSAILSSSAAMASTPTNWRWCWTTPGRASPTSSAAPTCSTRPRASFTSRNCWG